MAPDKIRLIDLENQTVGWHMVENLPWDRIWTISHVWDREETSTRLPLEGVSWDSNSFSNINRFNLMLEKTRQIVERRGAKYVWMDAACVNQGRDEEAVREKNEQVPFMGAIYHKSAGCVAFGKQTPKDGFVEIFYAYDDGRKAWVCDWFERVWTFQELQLPEEMYFISGNHELTRNEVYFSVLMMSPYLTSPHQSPPSHPSLTQVSTQDVINGLSPLSRKNTQRSLMQTSKRGCSVRYINDKVYGMLGVLPDLFSKLEVDYKRSLERAALDLMLLMPTKDVLDTLTFNTLPPNDNNHDNLHWSGMIRLDGLPTEHPSYEKDVYPTVTDALVTVEGEPRLATTRVHNAPLWKVVITKPGDIHTHSDVPVRAWPPIAALSKYFNLDGFAMVGWSAEYAQAVGRAERSLAANWTLLQPLLEKVRDAGVGKEVASFLQDPPKRTRHTGIPANRLGDQSLFDKEVTVLVCRSKEDKSFHYGIVVTQNNDTNHTWHKVCTAAFADKCVVDRDRVESLVVIGK